MYNQVPVALPGGGARGNSCPPPTLFRPDFQIRANPVRNLKGLKVMISGSDYWCMPCFCLASDDSSVWVSQRTAAGAAVSGVYVKTNAYRKDVQTYAGFVPFKLAYCFSFTHRGSAPGPRWGTRPLDPLSFPRTSNSWRRHCQVQKTSTSRHQFVALKASVR